jgi:hypothetical protein
LNIDQWICALLAPCIMGASAPSVRQLISGTEHQLVFLVVTGYHRPPACQPLCAEPRYGSAATASPGARSILRVPLRHKAGRAPLTLKRRPEMLCYESGG